MTPMMPSSTSQVGHTALELLLVSTLVATLAALAVPLTLDTLDDARAEAAARYLAARFALARGQAARRSARVAIRFERRDTDYVYATYLDGNRNGVLTRDVQSGIDLPLTPLERLSDRFSGVQFGVMRGVSPIEPGEQLSEGDDPVRAGSANTLSFAPDGSGTSGTVYVRGRRRQTAVRVLGATGRFRTLSFDAANRRWSPP